jgi:hypothetical protein
MRHRQVTPNSLPFRSDSQQFLVMRDENTLQECGTLQEFIVIGLGATIFECRQDVNAASPKTLCDGGVNLLVHQECQH